jgi:hypothetical protein
MLFLVVTLLLFSSITTAIISSSSLKYLVLIDPVCDYLSGHCREYCQLNNINVIECLSPYMIGYMQSKGIDVPNAYRAPTEGYEKEWVNDKGLTYNNIDDVDNDNIDDNNNINDNIIDNKIIAVLSESDAGVATAERIQAAIGCPGNGIKPSLRNKYLMNLKGKEYKLKTVEQILAKTWDEAEEFIEHLWNNDGNSNKAVIIKPYRGVASDGVYLANTLSKASEAFYSLIGKPKYAGGVNDAVLIQEYADGQEYAVDTIAANGIIKIVALWKYKKIAINGAPFVYQCSELVDIVSDEERQVCEYCIKILQAQELKWGPTHTEIKYTTDGPRLIEINARWHAQHFIPIVRKCIGYDAITSTLDGYFNQQKFLSLPIYPQGKKSAGLILHLISSHAGVVKAINYLDEINSLESVILVDLDVEIGQNIVKTVDIRTDFGYVLLCHEDEEQVSRDFNYIVQLQETMIEVEDANAIKYNPKINNNYAEEVVEEEYNDEEDEEDAEYEMEKVRRNEMLYPGSNQPSVLNSLVNIVRKLVGGTAILAVSSYVSLIIIIMFFSHFK